MPGFLPEVAAGHHDIGEAITDATAQTIGSLWSRVDPNRIVDSWAEQLPEAVQVLSAGQLAAARQADGYTDDALAAQDLDEAAVGAVEPSGFAGQASDGRGLIGLLSNPAVVTLLTIQDVHDVSRALLAGRANLDMLVRTQVQDAGRLADQVSLTAHPAADGYVRVTDGNPCARCLILAGKFYRWNRGFLRHPKCGCRHVPAASGIEVPDPRRLFDSMSYRERLRAGFTQADIKALDDGADIFQIVNARHRPNALLRVAGERPRGLRRAQRTFEGISDRSRAALFRVDPQSGRFVPRLAVDRPRWTVDEIYRVAGDDRKLAVDLLGEFGYLQGITRQPTLRDLRQAAKALGMRRFSRQSRRELVGRLQDLPVFPARPRLAARLADAPRGGAPGGVGPGTRAAKKAAPKPPTAAALKQRVTDAGITVPTGLRPDALRKLAADLDAGVPAAAARADAVKSILAERRTLADALDDVAADLTDGMTQRRMSYYANRLRNLPPEHAATVRPLVDALDVGDVVKARTALAAAARKGKLTPVAQVDGIVPLDRAKMSLVGDSGQQAGTYVQVLRPGYTTTFERQVTVLSRASVDVASPQQIAAVRAAKVAKKAAAPRKAAQPDLTGAKGLSTAPAVREAQIENRIRQAVRDLDTARTPGFGGTYIPLADIRHRLGDLPRGEVDDALRRMGAQPGVDLAPWDNRKALRPRDREASVRFGGQEAVVLRIDDPSLRPLPSTPAKATKAVAKKATPAKKAPAPKAPPAPEKMTGPALKKELQAVIDAAPPGFDNLPHLTAADLAGVPQPVLAGWVRRARELSGDSFGAEVGQWRQAIMDARRSLADLLTQADELVANGASAATMGARGAGLLKQWAAKAEGWPDLAAAKAVVAALQTGDPVKIRAAIRAAQRKVGLKQVGANAGGFAKFDRAAMKPLAGSIPDGARVTVIRPGYSVEIGGREVVLSRPVVQELYVGTVGPKASRLRTVTNPDDRRAQAMATNPQFGNGFQGPRTREIERYGAFYSFNCNRVAIAHEMRRRGLDVTATAATERGDTVASYVRAFRQNGKYALRVTKDLERNMSAREIVREVETTWPPGARGIVTMKGHTFNVERDAVTGKAVFIDAQAAKTTNPIMNLAQFERRAARRGAPTDRWMAVARVDDLDLSDYALRYVESPELDIANAQIGKSEFPTPDPERMATDEELATMTPDDSYP